MHLFELMDEDPQKKPLPTKVTPFNRAFRSWFGASVVVDRWNHPLRVYHGTSGDFDVFDNTVLGSNTEARTTQLGTFFTSNELVAGDRFARHEGGNVRPCYLRICNPVEIGLWGLEEWGRTARDPFHSLHDAITKVAGKASWEEIDAADVVAWRERVMSRGYDGIIINHTAMDAVPKFLKNPWSTFYIVFNTDQIMNHFEAIRPETI